MELQKENFNRFNLIIKRIRKISICLFLISSFGITNLNAQARESNTFKNPKITKSKSEGFKFDPSKLVVGGIMGASFGNVTYFEIAPTVGYLLSDNYLIGLSGKYIYFEDRTYAPAFVYKSNTYGGGIFNQYFFLENFIAHAEYEILNAASIFDSRERINIHSFFVGGGYRSGMGMGSYFSFMLLYNLNDSPESPYTNPILRLGVGVNL